MQLTVVSTDTCELEQVAGRQVHCAVLQQTASLNLGSPPRRAGHLRAHTHYCSHSPLIAKNGIAENVSFVAHPGALEKCVGQVMVPE